MHDSRKAAKRARYAADALVPVDGKPARRLSKRMKQIQSELGGHQDTVMARAALRDLALRARRAGENAFTYGLLYERDSQASRAFQDQAWQADLFPFTYATLSDPISGKTDGLLRRCALSVHRQHGILKLSRRANRVARLTGAISPGQLCDWRFEA